MATNDDMKELQKAADCAGLEMEFLELKRDAERYRWLCENNFDRPGVTQIHTWLQTWEPHSQTGEQTEWTQRLRGSKLGAAIDVAMAASAGAA